MSAEEVVELAMGGGENFRSGAVTEAVILSAQQKFIRPVLGALYGVLLRGGHEELLEGYLKTPLAYYVKYLLLPSVAAQVGMAGVVCASGDGVAPVDDTALKRLMRRVKSDADALMDAAVEHIESHREEYPEYDPRENIRNRVRIQGDILI